MKKILAVTLLLLGITIGLFGSNGTSVIAYDDLPGPHAASTNYF